MKKYMCLMLFILMTSILAVGCVESFDEKPSGNTEESSDNSESSEIKYEEIVSSTKVYEIGDTCSDSLTKITVNGKRYASLIDERNDEFYVAQAESGYEYLILDITLENISPNRIRSYASFWHYKIISPEGYTYEEDTDASSALLKALDESDVMPGTKRRGEVPFKVPIDSKGLKLQFMWDPLNNHDAVLFNL